MARVVIGRCPACSRELKAKEQALRPGMQFTCRCGWQGQVNPERPPAASFVQRTRDSLAKLPNLWGPWWQAVLIGLGFGLFMGTIIGALHPPGQDRVAGLDRVRHLLILCAIGVGGCAWMGAKSAWKWRTNDRDVDWFIGGIAGGMGGLVGCGLWFLLFHFLGGVTGALHNAVGETFHAAICGGVAGGVAGAIAGGIGSPVSLALNRWLAGPEYALAGTWMLAVDQADARTVAVTTRVLQEALNVPAAELADLGVLLPGVVAEGGRAKMEQLRKFLHENGVSATVRPVR